MDNKTSPPPVLPSQAAARLFGGDLALLEEGLKRGLRVDAIWPMWETPLLHGVCLFAPPQAPAMVKAILQAGAGFEQHRGLSPMLHALGGFNKEDGDPVGVRLEVIKVLHGADPSPDLALWAMTAVRLGFHDALDYILDCGCDPDSSLDGGHSLLHEAYKQKDAVAGNLLVRRGADPHAVNSLGQNAAEAAKSASDAEVPPGQDDQTNAELDALDLTIRTLKNSDDMPESKPLRL